MKKYLFTLLLLTVIISCGSDDSDNSGGTSVNANVNDLVVTLQKMTTPTSPETSTSGFGFFTKAGNNFYYSSTPNVDNEEQFMEAYNMDANTFTPKMPNQEVCACGYMSKLVNDGSSIYYIANEAVKYSISSNTWSEINYPQSAQDNNGEAGVTIFNNKIYFLGGRDATNKFKYYDIASDSWYNTTDYLYNVGTPELVVANDKIFAIGGDEGRVKFSYFIEGAGWTALPDLPFQAPFSRDNFTAAAFKDRYIFVLGYNVMYIYDIENNEWRNEPVAINNLQGSLINLFSDADFLYITSITQSHDFSLHKVVISQ